MLLKLKKLGMASIAALGISLLAVAGAQAVEFHSSAEHTIISGSQTTSLTWSQGGGFSSISCSTVKFEATSTPKTSNTWELQQTRSGCKDSLERTVDVDCEGVHKRTVTSSGESHTTCAGTARETITNASKVVVCTVTYVNQTNNGVTFKNLGGTNGVELTFKSTNVKSTIEGGFFGCGTSATDTPEATYTGTAIFKGTNTAGIPVELWVE